MNINENKINDLPHLYFRDHCDNGYHRKHMNGSHGVVTQSADVPSSPPPAIINSHKYNRSELPTTSMHPNNIHNDSSNLHPQPQLYKRSNSCNNNNNNINLILPDANDNSQESNHYHHYYSYYYHKSPESFYNRKGRNLFNKFPSSKMSMTSFKTHRSSGGGGGGGGVGGGKGSPRKRSSYMKGGGTAVRNTNHDAYQISAVNPQFSDDDDDRENNHLLSREKPKHHNHHHQLQRGDLFNENNSSSARGKASVLIRNQMVSPTDARYRYLDDENDNNLANHNQIPFPPRRIPRSTSESNDPAAKGAGGESQYYINTKRRNSNDDAIKKDDLKEKFDDKKEKKKILPLSTPNKNVATSDNQSHNSRRRPSPQLHRVLLYNSNTSLRSPRSSRRHLHHNHHHHHHHHHHHSHRHHHREKSPSESPTQNNSKQNEKSSLSPLRRIANYYDDNEQVANDIYDENPKNFGSREVGGHELGIGRKNAILREGKFVNLSVISDDTQDASSIDDDFDLDRISYFGDSFDSTDSSDSEDGYRSHAYKFSHQDKLSVTSSSTNHGISNISTQSSAESLTNPESLLARSLFPHVPPYLAFSSNLSKGPSIPVELYKILKWKVTNVMPKLVRIILANSGVRLLKNYPIDTNDWMGTWGKHMKSPMFKGLRPYQKLNHLPGSFRIGRKDACWRNLQKQMLRHGKKDFGFMPKTYIIPQDLNMLRKTWPKYAQRNFKWIVKPPASARGAGIRVVNRWAQIPKRRPVIVQKYIERPLLINGSKFDLRLYVLVTSVSPLRVFMYHNGLARFASVKYSDRPDTLNDRCMHLTNYSINKFSSNYSKNEDVNACHGHKWTIKSLWSYLQARGIRTDRLWEALRNLVLRTILAGENPIYNMIRLNVESKYSCYELFGFDVLLDSDLIPWLLEVNISPSLHSDLPLDAHVKAPLVQGILNTAMFQVPPKLSHEKQKEIIEKMKLGTGPLCFDRRIYITYLSRVEKLKHNQFTRKDLEDRDDYINAILSDLTPDDVRCLIVAEDEFARCAPLERIFPTCNTYKYLKYTDYPRYYNRLLDAWETRYSKNRIEGINLLKDYCAKKYHLQVPPTPVKKASNDNTETTRNVTPDTTPSPDACNEDDHQMAEKSVVSPSHKSQKNANAHSTPAKSQSSAAGGDSTNRSHQQPTTEPPPPSQSSKT